MIARAALAAFMLLAGFSIGWGGDRVFPESNGFVVADRSNILWHVNMLQAEWSFVWLVTEARFVSYEAYNRSTESVVSYIGRIAPSRVQVFLTFGGCCLVQGHGCTGEQRVSSFPWKLTKSLDNLIQVASTKDRNTSIYFNSYCWSFPTFFIV